MDHIGGYLLVFFLSMVKFFFGPMYGKMYHIEPWLTALLTAGGMTTIVTAFSYWLGEPFHHFVIKKFFKNRKLFTKSNRRKISIWRKYGLPGVAFLTPILFSPIGGALIANSFGADKKDIVKYMLISAILWAFVMAYSAEALGWMIQINPWNEPPIK